MNILVTGGAGYIGSHMVTLLMGLGHDVTIVDNFSNSSMDAVDRLSYLCPRSFLFFEADVNDRKAIEHAFSVSEKKRGKIDAVFHFAGLKAVGESSEQPLRYYQNNVSGTLVLCEIMAKRDVFQLIFSSSATVYGEPERIPLDEHCRTGAINPYGRSKLMAEEMLQDLAASDDRWKIALLRYFNPVGAHASGLIGELPTGIPNNIMPYICQVATGQREVLNIFGDDYETKDGTGVRDYIHVCDLVEGHWAALLYLHGNAGAHVFNLGAGQGNSVTELVDCFEQISGVTINRTVVARRIGDVGTVYADTTRAQEALGWKTKHDLQDMVRDHWQWAKQH